MLSDENCQGTCAIDDLASDPRPHGSQPLDLSGIKSEADIPESIELRRLRLGSWRVVYAIDENWQTVVVLAIRRRLPYDYEDLRDFIAGLQETS